jgi:hypothetical protein
LATTWNAPLSVVVRVAAMNLTAFTFTERPSRLSWFRRSRTISAATFFVTPTVSPRRELESVDPQIQPPLEGAAEPMRKLIANGPSKRAPVLVDRPAAASIV